MESPDSPSAHSGAVHLLWRAQGTYPVGTYASATPLMRSERGDREHPAEQRLAGCDIDQKRTVLGRHPGSRARRVATRAGGLTHGAGDGGPRVARRAVARAGVRALVIAWYRRHLARAQTA